MDDREEGEAADVDMGGGDATIHEAFESFVVEAEEMTRVMSSLENYSSRDNCTHECVPQPRLRLHFTMAPTPLICSCVVVSRCISTERPWRIVLESAASMNLVHGLEEGDGNFDLHPSDDAALNWQLLGDLATSEEAQTRINAILDKYQEQSQLLDPHLEKMVMVTPFHPWPSIASISEMESNSGARNFLVVEGKDLELQWCPAVRRCASFVHVALRRSTTG